MQLENINFSYFENEAVLKNVSIKINKGERIAVLGNNGAGKSTFFLISNGILIPDSGKLLYKGKEITRKKKDLIYLHKNVGIVFQEAENQIIASTVEGEVSFGPKNLKLSDELIREKVDNALETMNLLDYRNKSPQYLSGGEKKRLTIADILAMDSEIILLDEPTASLDPKNVILLEETLNKLSNRGITLLISTHDVDFAYKFADRVVVFSEGTIIADENVDTLFQRDDIIEQAGIKKPILYETVQCIKDKFGSNSLKDDPKNVYEFMEFIKDL